MGRAHGGLIIVIVSLQCPICFADLSFIKIADTSTAAPSGTGTFATFDPPTSNRNALPYDPIEIGFRATTSTGVIGIYSGDSETQPPLFVSVSRLADTTMMMPGFSEHYADFSSYSGGTSNTCWVGIGSNPADMEVSSGVAIRTGDMIGMNTLTRFGQITTGNYSDRFSIAFQGNELIFDARKNVIANDAKSPSVARSLLAPATTGYIAYSNTSDSVISEFSAPSNSTSGGTTRTVADFTTAIPNGSGNFTSFGDPVASPTSVIFRGQGASQDGVYRSTNAGVLSTVADLNTIVPQAGSAHFTTFGGVSPGDAFSDYDAFVATVSDGREGIYLAQGSRLNCLIDTTQMLDGKAIISLSISNEAIEDDNVAFKATFADGSQGVFAVVAGFVVPEPSTTAIMLMSFCGLGVRQHRPG